jgi:hypothetical protein
MPAMHEPIAQALGHAGSFPAHPEEIRATLKLRLGKRGRLNATFRTTPAGLVTAGIMTAAIFLSIAALVRAARRPIRHYDSQANAKSPWIRPYPSTEAPQ